MVDVAGDPTWRALAEAARAWGVPLSIFLGRKQATEYEYFAGKLVRSVTEPLWLEEDRQAAIDLLAYEQSLCPGCGGDIAETTAADAEDGYEAVDPLLCHRCVAKEQYAKKWQDHPHPDALLISVQRKNSTRGGGGGPEQAREGHRALVRRPCETRA